MTSPKVELSITEVEARQFQSRIRPASPFSAHGITPVQAHVSPMETVRVSGLPRSDLQFKLSDDDTGVPNE